MFTSPGAMKQPYAPRWQPVSRMIVSLPAPSGVSARSPRAGRAPARHLIPSQGIQTAAMAAAALFALSEPSGFSPLGNHNSIAPAASQHPRHARDTPMRCRGPGLNGIARADDPDVVAAGQQIGEDRRDFTVSLVGRTIHGVPIRRGRHAGPVPSEQLPANRVPSCRIQAHQSVDRSTVVAGRPVVGWANTPA